ncbi:BTB/POZ domain-containing protein 19 isoform X2 [Ursus maritimus]|uniref:BTB/POZ domain-containing protein 19 isoform X2 n=1 Tax=Ursus maritimus TaxID=29073 RepID=A0A8M1FSF3_URSMA|nr:BTB/POZ domain-containing protein 19 isoform X2 [Ursus maritimus]XP_057166676.1 BTB/POZ domain-containing protein 19 isoform X2 [Ursus arctos]
MADLWLEGLRPVPYMTDLEMKAQNGQRQSLRVVPQDRPLLPCFSPPLSHSDVCFVVGQERQEVFAHRCLLACRCNFFQRLLGPKLGPGMPSPVVLSTVPAEAFLAVLEFLYTNSVRLHRHSVLEVLTAAVEYGLEELREVAVTFGLGPLQERCIAFIEAHSQEALRTRGFLELSAPALLPLLRSDKLCVDEAELVLAARSWARVGAAVLERPVAEVAAPVVRELRLALLAPAELSALEEQNQREPLIPVEQIVEAWKCHALRRGDAARGAPCRRRRGTLPREHHCFLDLPFK